MDPFVGEIRAFGFPFAPNGWAFCNGQLLSIRSYTALFALLGTQFGGDGSSTFGLPNLVGNLALGTGQSPGGSNWMMGNVTGSATVTLDLTQLPMHNHGLSTTTNGATSKSVVGNQLAVASVEAGEGSVDAYIYASSGPNVQLDPQTLSPSGNGLPHPNTMPSVAMNYCIAVTGLYPQFN